jgi:hypothetical protein
MGSNVIYGKKRAPIAKPCAGFVSHFHVIYEHPGHLWRERAASSGRILQIAR